MKREFSREAFRYSFEFVIAGFVGWIYEVITIWILWRCYENRGMLHLPIIPIYAVGAFMLLAIIGRKKRSSLFVFFFSSILTTIFELGASYLLEFIFHRQFWTYETWYLSILDRSCVISSAIFGLFALIYFFGLHPLSGKLSEKLPKWFCIVFTVLSVSAIGIDLAISVTELLKDK